MKFAPIFIISLSFLFNSLTEVIITSKITPLISLESNLNNQTKNINQNESYVMPMMQDSNLVLGNTYTYYPPANYSLTQGTDSVDLTDGYISAAYNLWKKPTTVGWVDAPVVILFDLGEEASVSEILFYSSEGGGSGVAGVNLEIYASLNDSIYVLAGENPAPDNTDPPTSSADTLTVLLDSIRARYIAVVSIPPIPHYFTFTDEVRIMGHTPSDTTSIFPTGSELYASGAQELQVLIKSHLKALALFENLTIQTDDYIANWPILDRDSILMDLDSFEQIITNDPAQYDAQKTWFTEKQRIRAKSVYNTELLVWEEFPSVHCSMISMATDTVPSLSAKIFTAVNSHEATAIGIANLSDSTHLFQIDIIPEDSISPSVSFRTGRYFETSNHTYMPDVLLYEAAGQEIPSGESRLIWLESTTYGTAPGIYYYQINIQIGSNTKQMYLSVLVYDVTLDTLTTLSTGNWSGVGSTETNSTELKEEMTEHRQNTTELAPGFIKPLLDESNILIRPIQIDRTELAAELLFFQDFDQVGWFVSFNHNNTIAPHGSWFSETYDNTSWNDSLMRVIYSEWVNEVIDAMDENGWDKSNFYLQLFDEAVSQVVTDVVALVDSIDADIRIMLTMSANTNPLSLIDAGLDVFAIHSTRIEYDSLPLVLYAIDTAGREMWFYNASDSKYGSGREQNPLEWNRYTYWTASYHNAIGVHFWTLVRPRYGSWLDGPNVEYLPLIYLNYGANNAPIDVITPEKVIPSRRWEYFQMGAEDYMLLEMADERTITEGPGFKDSLDNIIEAVLTNRGDSVIFKEKHRELLELLGDKEPVYWTGETSNDWHTTTNWSNNAVPISNDTVKIPPPVFYNYCPEVSSAVNIKKIILYGDSELKINNGVLFEVKND